MSTVKFECPSCAQNMECERACSGDVIHCVGCDAELRIPFSSSKTGQTCVERAELIVPGAAPSAPMPSDLPPAAIASSVVTAQDSKNLHATESIEATCPVCQAHLRFDARKRSDTAHENPPPMAELVHHKQLTVPAAQPAPPQGTVPAGANNRSHLSFEERERQIAEGRKAHPIQTNSARKPRLDYILSGGANPPGKTPPPEQPKPDQKHATGHCHHDSFSE